MNDGRVGACRECLCSQTTKRSGTPHAQPGKDPFSHNTSREDRHCNHETPNDFEEGIEAAVRAWEIWLALLLLLAGGGCLVTAVQILPIGSLSDQTVAIIQMLRPVLLVLIFFALVWFLWRDRVVHKAMRDCPACSYQILEEWHYCPHCGEKVQMELPPER